MFLSYLKIKFFGIKNMKKYDNQIFSKIFIKENFVPIYINVIIKNSGKLQNELMSVKITYNFRKIFQDHTPIFSIGDLIINT